MRLRTVDPPLPTHLLDALADLSITSDADLIFAGTSMELYKRLPLGTVSLKELEKCIADVVTYISAAGVRGDKLITELERVEDAEQWGCGLKDIDHLVGGFGPGRVIEVSGDRASGKTALALQVILRRLSNDASSAAHWIDTAGDFSAERVSRALANITALPFAETAAERLQVSIAFDVEAIHEVLETMRTDLDYNVPPPRIRCLVIDNLTPIFRPLLSVVSSQG
ncbi:hypothetical protein PHLGIDRAFT_23644 [Phlebiopsis gigantea 11061_1 CR5-6]|uniref:Rad51-like C-terminal domain-containing protein n=1 Tax=Phlebiopsis gigantea (strain 11061_1 CR5-6) TaxID=745531 RepID=A0A0C3PN66_PHLG1|nr:hypothetical protein PHLGIDRAFT_23644 [Phlebiopsis gigantea 11061_1 CR5-6]